MFQDICVSKNLIDQYRRYCEERKLDDIGMIDRGIVYFKIFALVDFSVMGLTSNYWPFSTPPNFVPSAEVKFS